MKKTLFWLSLLFGLFFTIGAIVTVLSYTVKILDRVTLGSIPYLLIGIILDFVTNPAGMLGVLLLVVAIIIKRKQKQASSEK